MLVKGEPKTARFGRKPSLRDMGVTNHYLFIPKDRIVSKNNASQIL